MRATLAISETCEDRDYRCCDLFPPCTTDPDGELRADLTSDEYDLWYFLHLLAWDNR